MFLGKKDQKMKVWDERKNGKQILLNMWINLNKYSLYKSRITVSNLGGGNIDPRKGMIRVHPPKIIALFWGWYKYQLAPNFIEMYS